MIVILVLLVFILSYWLVETIRLVRARRAIPIRIHVNGSRGKSSVTRLIAAALREGGLRTFAKTTGTQARMILPDGSEEPVIRMGTPNICEQVGVLDRARLEGAEAIVLECMAVRPDLQRITEKRILHSTIGVITNARADHLDVMGPTVADVAVALSSTIPRRGYALLADTRHADTMRRVAKRRSTEFEVVAPDTLPPGAMDGFRYVEHDHNVAATLMIARRLGIEDEVSLRGMHSVTPDPGACTRTHFKYGGANFVFYNILAANDLESTISIWNRVGLQPGGDIPSIALLNLRGDRIDRSLRFADELEKGLQADYYLLVGDVTPRVQRRYEGRLPGERLITIGRVRPEEIFERIAALSSGGSFRVGGVGNIGGLGHQILHFVSSQEEQNAHS